MTGKPAVVFLAHKWDLFARLKYQRLLDEIGDEARLVLLIQSSDEVRRALSQHPTANGAEALFEPSGLPQCLGYPLLAETAVVPGSTHFPVLAWLREQPTVEACLVIEYDVEFSGNWRELLLELIACGPDFAALHFRSRREDPSWRWWTSLLPAPGEFTGFFARRRLRRSFNPVYWLSRRAIELVDAAHLRGWRGHYEVLLATLLHHSGCRLADLAELGGFCSGREQDLRSGRPVAELSTMRWRPEVASSEFLERSTGRTLFHPVKRGWLFDGKQVVCLDE